MIAMLALAAASTVQCPVERAHYILRHKPAVTAYFRDVKSGRDWPSDLALAIHDNTSGRTFWWLPWNGGTDGLQNVASTTDVGASGWKPPSPDGGPRPFGNREYLGMDPAYNLIAGVPGKGATAPAHMLFPNSAGAGDEALPVKQFFDLVSCSKRGR